MSNDDDIPTLTDLISKEGGFTMSELGLNDNQLVAEPQLGEADAEIEIGASELDENEQELGFLESDPAIAAATRATRDPFEDNPDLDHAIRRILDEHMQLMLEEIELAIRRYGNRDRDDT